jgi:hypothetical protein
MSYRFSNKGEKSASQILYEWLEQKEIGFEFSAFDVDAEISRSNISASCAFFESKGVIQTIGRKKMPNIGKGTGHYTRVYRFVAHHEGKFHSKPVYKGKRNRSAKVEKRGHWKLFEFPAIGEPETQEPKKQKRSRRSAPVQPALLQLTNQNVIDFMIEAMAYFEGIIKENERLRKLIDEKA